MEADIAAIADRIAGARRYFLQNFKDSGSLVGAGTYTAHTPQTLAAMCKIACDKGNSDRVARRVNARRRRSGKPG